MNEKALSSLTIFFPCYDDQKTISGLVLSADRLGKELTGEYEILVVDDGSSDGSREALVDLQRKVPKLRLIFHHGNQGYGAVLKSGFHHASRDWIFYTDGDGQYDPSDLKELAAQALDETDVVNGYKVRRRDPLYRVLIGEIYRNIARVFFRIPIRDVNCDFRLIRREVLNRVHLSRRSGAIGIELIAKLERAGCRFSERPVRHYPRPYGRSKFFSPRHLLRTGGDLLWLWREVRHGV